MASMDGHFRSPYRMEIVCNPLSFRGTSFQYSVIQLYLFLVEICNPNLNFGWMRYVIMHRHKYFCYYLFNILKRDLPKRTGPFHYVSVIFTPRLLPARRRGVLLARGMESMMRSRDRSLHRI